VGGFKTRLHFYSVPTQPFYEASRRLIMKGVDGVVFVADSRRGRMDANLESLDRLAGDLEAQGHGLDTIPCVLQLNQRDAEDAVPVAEMKDLLSIGDQRVLEAIAHSEEGIGVFDTLNVVTKLILRDLTKREEGLPAPISGISGRADERDALRLHLER
jgi:mutual gliding-motility protein MglA